MNKCIVIYFYLLIAAISFYIFSNIGNTYYFHNTSKLIITTSNTLTIEKTIFWTHNTKKESTIYNHIKTEHTYYFELSGQYNTANIIYTPFIISIFFSIKAFFLLFENHFIRYKYLSPQKYFTLSLFTTFFAYALNNYLYIGDIFDSTSAIHVKFDKQILIKGFVYTYNKDNNDYDISKDSIKSYITEIGSSSPDDGVSTQNIFDTIIFFSIYYILRWFYIVRNIFYKWKNNHTKIINIDKQDKS